MLNAYSRAHSPPEAAGAAREGRAYAPDVPSTATRIVIFLIFIAALLYATFGMGGVDCEVCVEYRGRSECRTVTAPDREQAIAQATATVCALISGGVTDSMECSRTPPTSLRCDE